MIPGAWPSRAASGGVRATMRTMTDPPEAPPRSGRDGRARGLDRRGRGDGLARGGDGRGGPRARPDRAAVGRVAPARLDVRAAADAGHRGRRPLVVVGGPAGQRRAPDQSRAGRTVRGVRRRPDAPSPSPCCPGIGRYDTTLFSVHMVQHLLLALVAAPLIALSAPITLLLRLASPGDTASLDPAGPAFPR